MPASLDILVRGERLQLLADRALYWPARQRLLIADLHLGKGDVFRRAGIAVPRGGTRQDLERIDALLAYTGARELLVLGDMLHGPVPQAAWRDDWTAWRHRHAELHVAVIAGNHDRRLAAADLGIELLADEVSDGTLLLRHEPGHHDGATVVCGHLHPGFAVPGIQRAWPGFWRRTHMLVLPAFSAFTGSHRVQLAEGEGAALCVDGSLVTLGAMTPD